MSTKKREHTAIVGIGIAACVACCAGPILGVLAAIGLGTATGVAMFGAISLVVGAAAAGVILQRRHRRRTVCSPADPAAAVHVELGAARVRS